MRKFIVILVGGLIVLQLFTFLTWSNKHNFIPLSKCDCASPGFNVAASLRYMDVVPESKVQLPRLDSQIPPLMSSARQTQPGDTESRKGTLLGPLFTNKNRMVYGDWIDIDTSEYTFDSPLQCNMSRVTEFKRRNPKYVGRSLGKSTLSHATNLNITATVLESLGINFFISHGTLLGWHRECSSIDYTGDVDLGIPMDLLYGKSREIISGMNANGFSLTHALGSYQIGFELKFFRGKHWLDMFGFYFEENARLLTGERKDVFWHGFWSGPIMRKMYFPFSKFQWANVTGTVVLVPVDIEEWLKIDYGENWMIADNGNWNWWMSPNNFMEEIHTLPLPSRFDEESTYGKNMLLNPSFEDWNGGTPVNWNVIGANWIRSSSIKKHGQRSLLLDNNGTRSIIITQEVNITTHGPSKFLVSGWGRKDVNYTRVYEPEEFGIHLEYITSGKRAKTNSIVFEPQITGQWQYKSSEIRISYDIQSVFFTIWYKNHPGPAYLENVSLRISGSGCKSDCNSRGNCVFETCLCFKGYYGELCEHTQDLTIHS